MTHTALQRPGTLPRPLARPGPISPCSLACRALVSAVFALLVTACPADAQGDFERWYAIEMFGQRAGWAMASQATAGDRITSVSKMRVEIRRGEVAIGVSIESEFVETVAGKPVSMRVTQRFGSAPTTLEATFTADGVEVSTRGPAGERSEKRPLPEGVWLPPAAAASYVRQRLEAGAAKIEVRTIDAANGIDLTNPLGSIRPTVITRSDLRPETIAVLGREVAATRCVSVSSVMPAITATEWLDAAGVPLRAESSLGGMRLVMIAATREEATATVAAPELMVSTFVRPRGSIDRPRQARQVELVMSAGGGTLPPVPDTGVQRATPIDARSARVTIDLDHPAAANAEDARSPVFLGTTGFLGSGDDRVRALAAEATAGAGDDRAARAEAMRRFVHRYIRRKGLDVGFAPAAEVARTRSGDCTEHAVLLAAMLRADGVPSRVAAGLVYADEFAEERGVFAYHMWTQALLDAGGATRWVDLDATLPPEIPMDAAHLALVVTGMGEGEATDAFLAIASLLGRIEIEIKAAR